jgi:outer membrane protein assembly factor BamB
VELDPANGEVLSREPLLGERAHVFGRTVTPTPDGYVFPNNAGLEIGDGEPAEIPGGATMSAAYADGRLFIANNEGVVFVLDAADGEVLAEVETDAVQPVAHAPALWTDTLYFAGRRGVFVAVDIPSATVAWNYDLPGGVFARPLVSEQGVYVFAGGVVTALTHSGEQLFVTPSGVSAAPAVSGGEIAYVTDAPELVVADAESGARIAGYSLPAESATRPVFADGEITVGLSNGEILRLLRESLQ